MASPAKNRIQQDELRKIQNKSAKVTTESVEKTREMLRTVNESKDAGVNTLQELYAQGDQLNKTERILDETSERVDSAQVQIKNIETANNIHCCCLPCLCCFKKNPERRRHKKSDTNKDQLKSKKTGEKFTGDSSVSTVLAPRPANDDRFFPKILGTNEEEEIENNLSHVSNHLSQLKVIALDMNSELSKQNEQLDGMNIKAEKTLIKIEDATKSTAKLNNEIGKSNSGCCCCSI